MKECKQCEIKYADNIMFCQNCGAELTEVEKRGIKEFLDKQKLKGYQVIIIYGILIALVFGGFMFGASRKYDSSYVSQVFKNEKSEFDDYTKQQKIYNEDKKNKENLEKEVSEIQGKVDKINEFEAKRDTYNSEIQDLSNKANDLSTQKSQKEKKLNDIKNELSKY